MRRFLIIIISLFSFCLIYSQDNRSSKIKLSISKDRYSLIPICSNQDSISGIIYPFDNPNERKKSREIVISWGSFCVDGSYELTITPEQIYLTSRHENPNPNILFWIIPINQRSYLMMEKARKKRWFKKRLKEICNDAYDNEKQVLSNVHDSIPSLLFDKCDILREEMSEKVLDLLNELINSTEYSIISTNKIIPNHVVYFGSSEDEILDWMPISKSDFNKKNNSH